MLDSHASPVGKICSLAVIRICCARENNMELEDYEQTKEGGIRFVEDIFRDMGGKVLPPMRPRHRYGSMTPEINDFMMDFENTCLQQNWDYQKHPGFHPLGPNRHEDPEWAAMIQSQCFPFSSEVDWLEYCTWVQNGGGDEWFIDDLEGAEERRLQFLLDREAENFEAGFLEAQTRLRTSYLCKDMEYPLQTPLDGRIVTMAGIVNQGGEEEEDEPEVKAEKRQCIRDTRCSGCGRDDDFCRCGGGDDNSIWWGS